MAGDKGEGLALSGTGSHEVTFNLDAVAEDITRTLDAEIRKRRATEPAGGTPRVYAAENRAMTAINPAELVVVAFVQDGRKQILQAAHAEVVMNRGGR
jgi:hypothetical protein